MYPLSCKKSTRHTPRSLVFLDSQSIDFPINTQPATDSRLVTILKVLKTHTKPRNIFYAEFSPRSTGGSIVTDAVDPEVELVDHMAGAGR